MTDQYCIWNLSSRSPGYTGQSWVGSFSPSLSMSLKILAHVYIYIYIYIYERELDHLDEHLGPHPYIVVISPGTNLFGDTPDPHNKKSKVNYQ